MSNQYRFISLKVIIDRLMRDSIMTDLDIDTAIIEAIDCIELIANPSFFDREDAYINIENYRGELPYNLVNITQTVRMSDSNSNDRLSMHSISDPFYKTYSNRSDALPENYDQYKIQGDYVYTNFEEGKLHMVYDALPLDTEGFIMIPDDVNVVKCVEAHIKYFHYLNKFNSGKLPQYSLIKIEEDKRHYMGKSQSARLMEGLDSAKSLSNILTKYINSEEDHLNNYTFTSNKEYRKLHR